MPTSVNHPARKTRSRTSKTSAKIADTTRQRSKRLARKKRSSPSPTPIPERTSSTEHSASPEADESKPPLLETAKRWPDYPCIKLCGENNGQEELIRPNDCVFVVPPGMDLTQRRSDAAQYWKARIVSIHRRHNSNTVWAIVAWFYTKRQLQAESISVGTKKAIDDLSDKELITSTHQDVIDVLCIEAKIHIHQFNDHGYLEEHITPSSWYTRFTISWRPYQPYPTLSGCHKSCICKTSYDPRTDNQRYCKDCAKWFHDSCLERISFPKWLKGETPASILQQVPIMRGRYKLIERNWSLVGTGRKIQRVVDAANVEKVNGTWEEWKHELGEEFIEFARETKFIRYKCPNCPAHI